MPSLYSRCWDVLVQVLGLRAAYPRLELAGKQGVHLRVLGEKWAPHQPLGKQAAGAPNVNFCPIWHLLIPAKACPSCTERAGMCWYR
jgi:hypothetical protein